MATQEIVLMLGLTLLLGFWLGITLMTFRAKRMWRKLGINPKTKGKGKDGH